MSETTYLNDYNVYVVRPAPVMPEKVNYFSLGEIKQSALQSSWSVLKFSPNMLILGDYHVESGQIKKKIHINESLVATVTFGDVLVPSTYSLEKITLPKLLAILDNQSLCSGLPAMYSNAKSPELYRFMSVELIDGRETVNYIIRSKTCKGAITNESKCDACLKLEVELNEKRVSKLPHPNTPLSSFTRQDLILSVKENRTKIQNLQAKVRMLINSESVHISDEVSRGLTAVMTDNVPQNNELLRLFWEEQKKALSVNPHGMRWHPMLIRFAIYLHFQSPRAYEALRESGVLRLPNRSTLRDYTNILQPKTGFQPEIFKELKKQADLLPPNKRFIVLLHDEMTIRADLVYDRRSGNIIGFTNPDSWTFKEDTIDRIASHVLVFMVVGINSHIKMSIGHIACKGAKAGQLYPLLWTAIAYLEMVCNLKVITSTSDKAPPNQRLYKMHKIGDASVVYKAINRFADEHRFVYFISDPPHLLKTLRNNVSKSKPGGSRYLWNNGKHILWSHVYRVYADDVNRELYRSKLTSEHVNLTASNTMSVRLAVQVLSRSVSQIMLHYYGPEMDETAKFFGLCDRFFDCLNVRSLREDILKRKPDLAPYRSVNDQRFEFLKDEFLVYLKEWYTATCNRPGFTKAEKVKMFLSYQTYEGIVMTVNAFIEATKYLLSHGVDYVLSQDFCQDPLEQHFGRHRGLAHRSDNPTLQQFGYQENHLRLQRNLAFTFQPKGNTAKKTKVPITISNSPLKKIKRH